LQWLVICTVVIALGITSDCEKTPQSFDKNNKINWIIKFIFVYFTMQYIQGISRNQLQMGSLEDKITADNSVRFIDAFVGLID